VSANPLSSLTDYGRFVAELLNRPTVARSTVAARLLPFLIASAHSPRKTFRRTSEAESLPGNDHPEPANRVA
jgi:hypothetical protein